MGSEVAEDEAEEGKEKTNEDTGNPPEVSTHRPASYTDIECNTRSQQPQEGEENTQPAVEPVMTMPQGAKCVVLDGKQNEKRIKPQQIKDRPRQVNTRS